LDGASQTEIGYLSGVTANVQGQLDLKSPKDSPLFIGTPLAPTATAGSNTTQIATTAFVQTEISNLVDAAPATLNTLNELAAALGDDANYATTVTNALALKAPLASPTFTGTSTLNNVIVSGTLTVNGSSATLNAATLSVDDINITIGDIASPTDATASGGGITLKGATDKTITWVGSHGGWEFNHPGVFTTLPAQGRAIAIRGDASGSAGILQFTNNAMSAQWASITATNGVINLNASSVTTSTDFTVYGNSVQLEGTGNYPNAINFNDPTNTSFWHLTGPRKLESDRLSLFWYNGSTYTAAAHFYKDPSMDVFGSLRIENTVAGGNGPMLRLENKSDAAGTRAGIFFGVDSGSASWGDFGNGEIIVENSGSGNTGIMKFRVYDGGTSEAMKICGNGLYYTAAENANYNLRNGVAFANAGIAIDKGWNGYPGIMVFNTNGYGDTRQGEFRFHGWNRSYSSYPATSGGDFGVNILIDGSAYSISDRRHKTNIVDNPYGLEAILALQPRKFDRLSSDGVIQPHQTDVLGFIAQEVMEVIPEAVLYHEDEDTPNEIGWCRAYSLDDSYIVSTLVNAIKEQNSIIELLKQRIEALENA